MPAVGCALPTSCRSALFRSGCSSLFSSVRRDSASRALSAPRRRCLRVRLAPRAPNSHHLCSVRPGFRQGLGCFDELLTRPRADPRVPLLMLTHAQLLSTHLRMLCVVCCTDQHHSPPLPTLCVEVHVSRAWLLWLSHSRRPLALANGLSMTAIVFREFRFGVRRLFRFGLWGALPPKLSRCDSPQLSPLVLAVCLMVSGHLSTQTCSN